MSSAKVSVLEKWSEFIRAGDREGMATVLAPDFVLYEDAGLPYGGVFRGVDGFLGMLANLQASWVDLKFEHLGFFDEPGGDSVAVHVRLTGRSPKTGEPMEVLTSEVFKIRDGRVLEGRVWYWDTRRLSQAMLGRKAAS